jgi:hypothetical protein
MYAPRELSCCLHKRLRIIASIFMGMSASLFFFKGCLLLMNQPAESWILSFRHAVSQLTVSIVAFLAWLTHTLVKTRLVVTFTLQSYVHCRFLTSLYFRNPRNISRYLEYWRISRLFVCWCIVICDEEFNIDIGTIKSVSRTTNARTVSFGSN